MSRPGGDAKAHNGRRMVWPQKRNLLILDTYIDRLPIEMVNATIYG